MQPGYDGSRRRNRSDRQARDGDVPLLEQSLHLLHARDGFDGLKILAGAINADARTGIDHRPVGGRQRRALRLLQPFLDRRKADPQPAVAPAHRHRSGDGPAGDVRDQVLQSCFDFRPTRQREFADIHNPGTRWLGADNGHDHREIFQFKIIRNTVGRWHGGGLLLGDFKREN